MATEYEVTITAEDIANAMTFMPLASKEVLTRSMAVFCVEPVEVKGTDGEPLPTMFRENRKLRHQIQMGILATMLNRNFELQSVKYRTEEGTAEEKLSWCMDAAEYDKWASSHVVNQLERLKKCKDSETVNKVFDLLYDYKATELMLSGAIRDELEARNDVLNRAMQYLTNAAVQSAMDGLMNGEIRRALEEREEKKDG